MAKKDKKSNVVQINFPKGYDVDEIKGSLVKAFSTRIDANDTFADSVMEELIDETEAVFNFYYSKMFKEIINELKGDE